MRNQDIDLERAQRELKRVSKRVQEIYRYLKPCPVDRGLFELDCHLSKSFKF